MNSDPQSHLWISEIKQDDQVRGQYLVRMKRMASTKKGDPFLVITLSDRTGDIEAKVWEKAEELTLLFKEGDVWRWKVTPVPIGTSSR